MAGKRSALLGVISLLLTVLLGCSGEKKPEATDVDLPLDCAVDEDGDGYGLGCLLGADCNDEDRSIHEGCAECATPEAGCPCEAGTAPVSCFEQSLAGEDTLMCAQGTRYCRDAQWTECKAVAQFELDIEERRELYAATALRRSETDGRLGMQVHALVPDPPDTDSCSPCRPNCYPVEDLLDPGGLSSSNSKDVVNTSDNGITVENEEVIQTVTTTTTCVENVCTMPGVETVCDDDCDGIPNAYDLAIANKPFGTTATSIFMDLAVGEYENAVLDLAFYVRTADVYLLIDATTTMGPEITQLHDDMQTGSFLADSRECGDLNRNGSTADEDVLKTQGIAGNIACRLRDGNMGLGWVREIPFAPYGDMNEAIYEHLVDLQKDPGAMQTMMGSVVADDNLDATNEASAQMLGLYTAATGSEMYVGWNRPAVPARTSCTLGTWGYPCFRSTAFPMIVLISDSYMHNGPPVSTKPQDPPFPYDTNMVGTVNAGHDIPFAASDLGQNINIANAASAANNGTWKISAVTSHSATYESSSCVPDLAFKGTWSTPYSAGVGSAIAAVDATHCKLTVSPEHHYYNPTRIRDSSQADPLNDLPFDGNDLISSAFDVGKINLDFGGTAAAKIVTYVGDTRGMTADPDFEGALKSCLPGLTSIAGPDAFYKFSVTEDQELTVSTRGSRFPTALGVFATLPGSSSGGGGFDYTSNVTMADMLSGNGDTAPAELPEPLPPGVDATLTDGMVTTAGFLPREVAGNECYDASGETNQGNSGNASQDYGPDLLFKFNVSDDMDLDIWAEDTGPNMSLTLFQGLPQEPITYEVPDGESDIDVGTLSGTAYRLVAEGDTDVPSDDVIETELQPTASITGAPFRNFAGGTCESVQNDTAKGIKVSFTLADDPGKTDETYDIAIETNGQGNGLDVQKEGNGNQQIYHAIGLASAGAQTTPDITLPANGGCEDEASADSNASCQFSTSSFANGWLRVSGGSFDGAPTYTADIPGEWLDNVAASACDDDAAGYDTVYRMTVDQTRTIDIEANGPVSYLSVHKDPMGTLASSLQNITGVGIVPSPTLETIPNVGSASELADYTITGIGGGSATASVKSGLGPTAAASTYSANTDGTTAGVIANDLGVADNKNFALGGNVGTNGAGGDDKDIPDGTFTCDDGNGNTKDLLYKFTLSSKRLVRLKNNMSFGNSRVAIFKYSSGTYTQLSSCLSPSGSTRVALPANGSGEVYVVAFTSTSSGDANEVINASMSTEDYWLSESSTDRINDRYIAFEGATTQASADVTYGTFGSTCIGGTLSTDARKDIMHVFTTSSSATTLQIEHVSTDAGLTAVAALFPLSTVTSGTTSAVSLGTKQTPTSGNSCIAEAGTSVYSVSANTTYALVVSTSGGSTSSGSYSIKVRAPDPPSAAETYTISSAIDTVSTNHVSLNGTTAGRNSTVNLSTWGCTGTVAAAQPDILHVFSVPNGFDNLVRIKNVGSTGDSFTAVAKLFNYASSTLGTEVTQSSGSGCVAEGSTSSYRIQNTSGATKTYAVVVSNGTSTSSAGGAYSVEIIGANAADPTSAETYTVAGNLDSRGSYGGYLEFQGSTADRSMDVSLASGCSATTGTSTKQSDVIHVFTIGNATNVTLSNTTTSGTLNAVVSLYSYSSGIGTLQSSGGTSCLSEGNSLTFTNLAAGTYAAVVSSASSNGSGAYNLRVLASSASTLTTAEQYTLQTTPSPAERVNGKDILLSGTTVGRNPDITRASLSCIGGSTTTSSRNDVLHIFSVNTANTKVRIENQNSASFAPVVGLFSWTGTAISGGAIASMSATTCVTEGGSASYNLNSGTYALVVSSGSSITTDAGSYSVRITEPDPDQGGNLLDCAQTATGETTVSLTSLTLTTGTYYIVAKTKDFTTTSEGAFTLDVYDRTSSAGSFTLDHCVECANQSTAGCINDSSTGGKHVTTRMVVNDLPPGDYTAVIRPTSGSDEPRFRVLLRDLAYLPMPVELSNGEPACHNTRNGGNDSDSFSVQNLQSKDSSGEYIDYYLLLRRFSDSSTADFDFEVHLQNNETPTGTTTPDYCAGAVSEFGEVTQKFKKDVTYYAVVKGQAATDEGWYQMTFGKVYDDGSIGNQDNATGDGVQEIDDVPLMSWNGNDGNPSVEDALVDRDIRVVGINPGADMNVTEQLETIAINTNATRLDGTGLVSENVQGVSLSQQVVRLVEELSFSTQSNVSVQLLKWPDDPYGAGDDFDFYVTAIDSVGDTAADGCEDVADTIFEDANNDGVDDSVRPDTHVNCTAGATPEFQVTFGNRNELPVDCKCDADPDHEDCATWDGTSCLGYEMTLQLVADNQYIVEQIGVYIVPEDILPEPNYTEYEPSGSYWQDFNAANCVGSETPDWTDLEWDLLMPASAGASVAWEVCANQTALEGTDTCAYTPIATVTSNNAPCDASMPGTCPNGICSHGQCQYVRGKACTSDETCSNGSCINDVCTWTSLPIDVGPLLPPGENGYEYMRVRASMTSSTDLRSAPEIYDWTMRYWCEPTE